MEFINALSDLRELEMNNITKLIYSTLDKDKDNRITYEEFK